METTNATPNPMKQLSPNWFAEGLIDFEYKQYVLLAYLEEAKRWFAQVRVYPALADLISHYRSLKSFQESKQDLSGRFPRKLTGVDLAQYQLQYSPEVSDDDAMAEIDRIVGYALPLVQSHVEQGRELYDLVEDNLSIEPVGVMPLYKNEGYVLIRQGGSKDVTVYRFAVSIFGAADAPKTERFTGIHTQYTTTFRLSPLLSWESIKMELIRSRRELPNPATYAIESKLTVPLSETLLPIAKRRLLGLITAV